nr:extracellular solute-binding protein [Microbacterium bovistercoris]
MNKRYGTTVLGACAVVAAATMILAGCSGGAGGTPSAEVSATATDDLAALVKDAQAERTLTIYTAIQKEQMQPWVDAFAKKYKVQVQIQRLSSADLGTAFETQEKAGKTSADIIETSNWGQQESWIKNGWIANYTPKSANQFPADRIEPGYLYPLYQSNGAIAWNTKVVPDSVQKELAENPWDGLLDPALKGKIVLIDPGNGGSGMAYYANLVYNLGDQYGWPYLEKLAAQKPAIATSIASISQQVAAGTYYATDFGDEAIFGPLVDDGAPVQYQGLSSTMNVTQFIQSIPSNAPHPAAARLWAEWSTTLDGQTAMTAATGGSSSIKGWTDNNAYKDQTSWYTAPKTAYVEWRSDPRLQGDQLKAFIAKWDKTFGVSQ